MDRHIEYKKENVIYTPEYPKEAGGAFKCKNYEIYKGLLSSWWIEAKGLYICLACDMLFGEWCGGKGILDIKAPVR